MEYQLEFLHPSHPLGAHQISLLLSFLSEPLTSPLNFTLHTIEVGNCKLQASSRGGPTAASHFTPKQILIYQLHKRLSPTTPSLFPNISSTLITSFQPSLDFLLFVPPSVLLHHVAASTGLRFALDTDTSAKPSILYHPDNLAASLHYPPIQLSRTVSTNRQSSYAPPKAETPHRCPPTALPNSTTTTDFIQRLTSLTLLRATGNSQFSTLEIFLPVGKDSGDT